MYKRQALYDAVARKKGIPLFSLDPREVSRCEQTPEPERDITPDEAEDAAAGQQVEVVKATKESFLSGWIPSDWVPDSSVWKSWAITPFYGSLLVVGVLLLLRVCLG